MCGIAGKFAFNGDVVERGLVKKMCDTIIHRGPDDEGVYTAPYIGLGQRRLAINDLSREATAPLPNEDKTVWVVFNGEIYNFQSLRESLIEKGHVFHTKTDTEVIVHLYEEYGVDCVQHMRGMFAFAVWDSVRKKLFAARDRLGKKPFNYIKTASGLVFGSEIKAITANPEISREPDLVAIDSYLTYQYVPSPRTAFSGISKLRPGHVLECDANGNISTRPYWQPGDTGDVGKMSPDEIKENIVDILRESVRLRMISDVPLGAFLSGGIDSGTIVALMAMESASPVKTFSIGFDEDEYNELPLARILSEKYGTEHHEHIVRPNAVEVLPLLVRHYNEPFADSSAIPTYYVSKMAREHVTVALSGDGGDESFSGYDRYGWMMRWSKVDRIPYFMRKAASAGFGALTSRFSSNNTLARMNRGLDMLERNLPARYCQLMSTVKREEKEYLYTPEFRSVLAEQGETQLDADWSKGDDELDWMMRHDQRFYLPDCLLVKTDIASMANSLELRSPFLDHRFIEFAYSIPSSLKRDAGGGKVILKEAVRSLLPEEYMTAKKKGFSVPVSKWFRNELSGMLADTLLDDTAASRGLFRQQAVRKLVEEHQSGVRDWGNRLWALLFLELWFREFID